MSIFRRVFRRDDPKDALRALYVTVVAAARRPDWYERGQVPDTLDGRFDMVAAVLALVLLRFEQAGEAGCAPAARLTELFVEDMDGQMRQQGVGDVVVGKHVGQMMSALGGRIGAYRDAFAEDGDLAGALVRNLWRGDSPGEAAVGHVAAGLRRLRADLAAQPLDRLLAGALAP